MVTDIIAELQHRGFTADFVLLGDHLFRSQKKCFISSDEFDVVEMHSFDDDIFNRHEIVLYAIECITSMMKGILLESTYDNASIMSSKIKKFWK